MRAPPTAHITNITWLKCTEQNVPYVNTAASRMPYSTAASRMP